MKRSGCQIFTNSRHDRCISSRVAPVRVQKPDCSLEDHSAHWNDTAGFSPATSRKFAEIVVQSTRLHKSFCRLRHAAFLIGTLKPPPVPAIRKSVPPRRSPPIFRLRGVATPRPWGLPFGAIRPRLAQPGNKKGTLHD
jgi:hypothetical protein